MQRSSSLLAVFSLRRASAAYRRDLMRAQIRHGMAPHAELVADSPLVDMRPVLPPRGQRAAHASYRVTYLRGGVLHARVLLPGRPAGHGFALRVHHPGGAVESLEPIAPAGPITESALSLRLRPGTTVVEIGGGGRIAIHWDGTSRLH
jgi:hypothetical protein